MDVKSYSEARRTLAKLMDRVADDLETIIITRRNKRPVVMVSLEELNALHETEYLLRSPANRERLLKAINQVSLDDGQVFSSLEEVEQAAQDTTRE